MPCCLWECALLCVCSSAWYLAVLGEELDPSHGSNHVVHEAVLGDCRLLSLILLSWEAKNFYLFLFWPAFITPLQVNTEY